MPQVADKLSVCQALCGFTAILKLHKKRPMLGWISNQGEKPQPLSFQKHNYCFFARRNQPLMALGPAKINTPLHKSAASSAAIARGL